MRIDNQSPTHFGVVSQNTHRDSTDVFIYARTIMKNKHVERKTISIFYVLFQVFPRTLRILTQNHATDLKPQRTAKRSCR